MKIIKISLILIVILNSCSKSYTPKPRAYFRIDFPEQKYLEFDSIYPYSFEYPVYSKLVPDNDKGAEAYWLNICYPSYHGKIHISYKKVTKNLAKYLEDAHELAYKHTVKADAIDENLIIDKENKVYGTLYEIRGNAASSVQFFLTDSVRNFLRGSLYFNNIPNKDSLDPVIRFVKKDIEHLIKTFRWKKEI